VSSGHVEWLSYALSNLGTQGIESLAESAQATTLRAYFSPDSHAGNICRELRKDWKGLRLPAGNLRIIAVERIEPRNWVSEWHTQYHPVRVGKKYLIVPSWYRRDCSPELLTIRLDPQNAFGSGTHASTRLCLLGIAEFFRPGMSAIDVGTGSGILAIAMARVCRGRYPAAAARRLILAIDSDPEAVATARKNARRNGVRDLVSFRAVSAQKYRGAPAAFLTANLTAMDLLEQAGGLTALGLPGAIMLLSGLQATDTAEVRKAFQGAGCKLLKARTQEGWALLVLQKLTNTPGCGHNTGS
jgi:ribosomal protein L11 methyltransferase